MAAQKGVQVPVDGVGKITGAFAVPQPDGTTIWVGATVLVDAAGNEIGSKIQASLERLCEHADSVRDQLELTGALG